MAEDIKSALCDATPSWNGYVYQGKIGIYVVLKKILQKLQTNPNREELVTFLENYSIEYEWIEDFAIKNNTQYESLHQVKHKAGNGFSTHISAVVTILNRKRKILSATDFIKYQKFDIQDKDELLQKVQDCFQLMQDADYLNENNQLKDGWENIDVDIADVEKSSLIKLLHDFKKFSENTFDNSKVYFHTAENVTTPRQNIEEYAGIPHEHHDSVRGLRSLSSLDIFLDFDDQTDFELALQDQEVEDRINQLALEILELTQIGESYQPEDLKLYTAKLCRLIDIHIVARHKKIRNSETLGYGLLEQRDVLRFQDFYDIFRLELRATDDEYWELCSRLNFESAYNEHCTNLIDRINDNHNRVVNEKYLERLQSFRTNVLFDNQINFTSLLQKLFPDELKTGVANAVYYSSITEKTKIKNVFMKFIQQVQNTPDSLVFSNRENSYHPTCIDISDGEDEYDWEKSLEQCKLNIESNELITEYIGATHLAIKTNPAHNVSEIQVQLNNIVETIDQELTDKAENQISNLSTVKFERNEDAIRNLNEE
ncbi:ABC-three component system protein [Pseudoalteromonas spongiae]|uniref:ABC-three component system protein n=1 Tax=Pseudoalteromonas spongiae TaxID=298657 RepID=UPI00110B0158|nr:ABC-three component system protein [Pseudoalteromonas spongiae]TMO81728.1 hypothetical protein CWC15_20575 [Pseudoalteromonas spongiae]